VPFLDRNRIVAPAFLDLWRHGHGLLDAVVDIEAVAIAAGAAGRVDVLRHQRVVLARELLLRDERQRRASATIGGNGEVVPPRARNAGGGRGAARTATVQEPTLREATRGAIVATTAWTSWCVGARSFSKFDLQFVFRLRFESNRG
jgi:hypothetical protein